MLKYDGDRTSRWQKNLTQQSQNSFRGTTFRTLQRGEGLCLVCRYIYHTSPLQMSRDPVGLKLIKYWRAIFGFPSVVFRVPVGWQCCEILSYVGINCDVEIRRQSVCVKQFWEVDRCFGQSLTEIINSALERHAIQFRWLFIISCDGMIKRRDIILLKYDAKAFA